MTKETMPGTSCQGMRETRSDDQRHGRVVCASCTYSAVLAAMRQLAVYLWNRGTSRALVCRMDVTIGCPLGQCDCETREDVWKCDAKTAWLSVRAVLREPAASATDPRGARVPALRTV